MAQVAANPKQSGQEHHEAQKLGPFLCWAVVFADIGTSIYYVPGILYGQFGARSAIFVLMTLFVFILLCVKYAEVTWRYPEGGGVVNVASQALHPFAGLLDGLFILAFSGLESIAQLAPAMREPRKSVAYRAMGAVVMTMAITSPLLTLWSTTLLNGTNPDPNQFMSLLGAHVAGPLLGDYVAISGSI